MRACSVINRVPIGLFPSRRGLPLRIKSHGCRFLKPIAVRRVTVLRAQDFDQEGSLSDQLGKELSFLDETLANLKEELRVAEKGEERDAALLAQLVEEVKAEQESWFEEVAEMEKLMQEAALLENSEAETESMKTRYEALKRKIELFSGLLREREREVDSLQNQLADVQQMGEVKRMKEQLAKPRSKIVAGSAAVEVQGEATDADATSNIQLVDFHPSSHIKGPEFDSPLQPKEPSPPSRRRRSSAKKVGMEVPGYLIVSAVIVASKMGSAVWNSLKKKLSKEARALVEVIAFASVAMGVASIVSSIV